MEHQLWKEILAVLAQIDKPRRDPKVKFTDEEIVKTWLWAVSHDRPVAWACEPTNWPIHERRRRLPSPPTMSRRLRSPSVDRLLAQIERSTLVPRGLELVWSLDGKPLVISGCSKDRQAGYGRATGGKAKGYQIHALVSFGGWIAAWRVAPMNKDERVMAHRLLNAAAVQGYVLADSNYDSNKLHQQCEARGNLQMVVPRR